MGAASVGFYQSFRSIAADSGFVYCATSWGGLVVIDATNPVNPVTSDTLELESYTEEIALWGGYAFLTNWFNADLYIVDITDPYDLALAGQQTFDSNQGGGIAVRDTKYLYLGTHATKLFSVAWSDLGDIQGVGSIDTDGADHLFFDGEFLYAAENEDGLKIFL